MKIVLLKECLKCEYNQCSSGPKTNRFNCMNPEARRKNGNYRIINKELLMLGKFPKWCKLEDYKEVTND